MQYFKEDFLNFFYELSQNNHRDWFNENRKTYERAVREPFKVFVGDLIKEIQKEKPSFELEPKNAIFRINRDLRFSKDKTPYKEHIGAIITHGGRHAKETPGHYIQLSGGMLVIGGGAYFMEKESLYNLRKYLMDNPLAFEKLLAEKDFKKKYGAIQGTKNKRLPKEFRETAEDFPLLFNKQFYYMTELPPEKILSKNLLGFVLKFFKASDTLNSFLSAGMK